MMVLYGFWMLSALSDPQTLAQCLAQIHREPQQKQAMRCLYRTSGSGNPALGIASFETLSRDYPENPWCPYYLGFLYFERDKTQARAAFARAVPALTRLGFENEAFTARLNLILLLNEAGSLEEAAQELDVLGDLLSHSAVDPKKLATRRIWYLLLKARWHLQAGRNLGQALLWLQQAEAALNDKNADYLRDSVQLALGEAAYRLADYAKAENYFRAYADAVKTRGDLSAKALALYQLAIVSLSQPPSPFLKNRAVTQLRQALKAAETADNLEIRAKCLLLLGKSDPGQKSTQTLLEALALTEQLNNPPLLTQTLYGLALKTLPNHREQAHAYAARAEATITQSETPWALVNAWPERFRWFFATLPAPLAFERAFVDLRAIETLRTNQPGGHQRMGLFSVWSSAYYWLIGSMLKDDSIFSIEKKQTNLLALSERLRARQLQEAMQISGGNSPQLEEQTPATPPGVFSLAELQASLEKDQALFSFILGDWQDIYGNFGGGSWLMMITANTFRTYPLPGRDSLNTKLATYLDVAAQPGGLEQVALASENLYRLLLADGLAELEPYIRRLIIVPDGLLSRTPISALLRRDRSEPLSERFQISMIPSLSLWLDWRRRRAPVNNLKTLILADPTWAPSKTEHRETDWPPTTAGLVPLPRARQEGKRIHRMLGEGSRLLLGAAAGERRLKQLIDGTPRVLHMAAHASWDDRFPHRSAVTLAADHPDEDGLLRPEEIASLKLRDGLVVISACQSATGSEIRGEGMLSLARPFFQAGSRAVVGSLWRIDDAHAERLFVAFYQHLSRGACVGEALNQAQQEMRAQGLPASAWAAPVVWGDDSYTPYPQGFQRSWWLKYPAVGARWAALGALLLALIVLITKFRRQR